jgi:monoamine oxidase
VTTYDLLIVGGGPAGIGTAHRLRDSGLHIKVLEAMREVGGRTKSIPLAGGMANVGAQFVYRGTPSEHLAAELGLAVAPFEPSTYGIAVDGATSIGTTNSEVVAGLPLSVQDRDALLHVLDDAVAEYRGATHRGAFTADAERLADQTVAERFRSLPRRAREVLETAVRGGAVGDTEHLIAQYALRYFASYPAHERENRLLVLDGMQRLTTGMAAALCAGTVDLATRATRASLDPAEDVYVVAATGPHGPVEFRAHQVLLAVPAPLVASIAVDLPEWKQAALDRAETPGSTTMAVAADVRGVEHHRDWAFVTTVGSRFDCIINPTPGRWRSAQHPGIVHYVCYGNDPGYQPELPGNPEAQAEWVEDFLTVAPGLRGRILDVHVETWEHCFALLSLGRAAVIDELQRPVGRLHFAGDWTSQSAGTHGALGEAQRVADAVLAMSSRPVAR